MILVPRMGWTYGGAKTYYSHLKFRGTALRIKIGRVGDIKLIDARARAHTIAENATKGIDPGEKRRENLHDITKFKEQTRDRFLQSDELQRLFAALETEQNEIFKNYILISLYSGQRRSSILSLRWSQVDLVNGFIYLPDTKNGEPMQVPMTNQLRELFEKINHNKNSDWVLPSVRSKSGHLEDPKRPWHELLRRAGIENLRLHDLRRTMGSYQAISGASLYIIGKSLGA